MYKPNMKEFEKGIFDKIYVNLAALYNDPECSDAFPVIDIRMIEDSLKKSKDKATKDKPTGKKKDIREDKKELSAKDHYLMEMAERKKSVDQFKSSLSAIDAPRYYITGKLIVPNIVKK